MSAAKLAHALRRATRGLGGHPGRFLSHALGLVRARIVLLGATIGAEVIATGWVDLDARGAQVLIGSWVTFGGGMIHTSIKARPGATVSIGDHTVLNYAVDIDCFDRIEIGAHCMFGSMVKLCDHTPERRGPIIIEDGVWVAHGVCIEPGVRVGRGSVLAAGSVISQDVPPESMAIGRPARHASLHLSGETRRQHPTTAIRVPS